MKIAVLTYHRVNDAICASELVVHPDDFKLQMNFLYSNQEQFQVISLHEALRLLRGCKKDEENTEKTYVLLTFDDGYRDNFIHAFTALREYGFSALIFLTTDYIGTDFKKSRYRDVPWRRDYLDNDEISEMKKHAIDFGGHSATHPHLKKVDQKQVVHEVSSSFAALHALMQLDDIAFCYPYGECNDTIVGSVKKAGFSCAFTVTEGFAAPGDDIFRIKRIMVNGQDDIFSFKEKLNKGA